MLYILQKIILQYRRCKRNVHDNIICLLVCCINMELGSEYVQVQSQNVITVVEADDAATPYTISPKRKMLKCS